MHISDFDFELPDELIAQYPLAERSRSRLLHVDRQRLTDRIVTDLPALLSRGDILVFNNTKVIKARVFGQKSTGGRVEVMVERVLGEREFLAQLRSSHSPKPGASFTLEGGVPVEVLGRRDDLFHLRVDAAETVLQVLDRVGHLPLPPYIQRADDQSDESRYQTVYAREPGAVAAPTAGLHFDEALLQRLDETGIAHAEVTLHVGAGTFQPVRVEDIREHKMHSELYSIPPETVAAIEAARARGGKVVAIGTTSLRALEAASQSGRLAAGSGETDIFITPGYRFKTVDRLLTNFHLPKSTLLMLVSAFGGYDAIRAAYAHAVAQRYRFFSYGDAMLLERDDGH